MQHVTDERNQLTAKYSSVIDADAKAKEILTDAKNALNCAKSEADNTVTEAKDIANTIVADAKNDAARIRQAARKAEEKASEAKCYLIQI